MGTREEHNPENVLWWLARLASLGERRRGTIDTFFQEMPGYLDAGPAKARGQGRSSHMREQGFSRSSYYDHRKDPERAAKMVFGLGYEYLKHFVRHAYSEEPPDPEVTARADKASTSLDPPGSVPDRRESRGVRYSSDVLFRQLALFVDQGDREEIAAARDLPGLYKTYRPSLSQPGYVVVGLLSMRRRPDGLVETFEEARLQSSPNGPLEIQTFEGCITYSHQGLFFLLTDDDNSQFPRVSILQASTWQKGRPVRNLDGVYTGQNVRSGIAKIVATHIRVERVHDDPEVRDQFMDQIGYRKLDAARADDQIDAVYWSKVCMGAGKHGIFEF